MLLNNSQRTKNSTVIYTYTEYQVNIFMSNSLDLLLFPNKKSRTYGMRAVERGRINNHMTSGKRLTGKRGRFCVRRPNLASFHSFLGLFPLLSWPLSTPLSASFHSTPIRLPREDWKEAESRKRP